MIIDKDLELSSKQEITATAVSTNQIDNGAPGNIGIGMQKQIVVTVDEDFEAAGAARLTVQLYQANQEDFSDLSIPLATNSIAKTTLVKGYQLYMPIPVDLDGRYFKLNYAVLTGPFTAGKISAAVVCGVQKSIAYPDAI